MQKTKLLFLARRYSPHIGGVETHIKKVSEKLLKNNFDITVVTEQDDPQELLKEEIGGITVLRIPLPNQQTNKIAIWQWIIAHSSLFLSSNIIHIHDVFFWILPLYPFLKLLHKNIFMTFHGYEGSNNPKVNQKFWHQIAALLTKGNICIGGFHRKWYGVKPTSISFGAVEEMPIKATEKNKTVTRILYAGRLAEDTGIMSYLSAIKKISKNEKVLLDVFGDGPQLALAKDFVKQHDLPVTFHGFVQQSAISRQMYDIAFVSRYLAILECFSVGLPVVAHYNVEIKRDYLLDTPFKDWLVAAESSDEIINGYKLITSKEWQSKIKAAQDWSKKQTWQKMADQYQELWKGGDRG